MEVEEKLSWDSMKKLIIGKVVIKLVGNFARRALS